MGNWKHVLFAFAGAALPAVMAGLEGHPMLTWPVAAQALIAGLIAGVASVTKGGLS
jgi:hypothetical protein